MPKDLQELIIKMITFIPGIVGLSAMDLAKGTAPLKEGEWEKGLSITEISKGAELAIAIIVKKDVNAKVISKEVYSSIKQAFKQNNVKLANLNIYIRGVK